LGNFFLTTDEAPERRTGWEAARALFDEMPGIGVRPDSTWGPIWLATYGYGNDPAGHGYHYNPDPGRKFISANGGCTYIDHAHLEICLPETLTAYDYVACWHAMLRMTRSALERVNSKLHEEKIQVLVNNSDGLGNSYGGHVNFLISRRCFQNIFDRKLHYLLYLASFLTSSIVFTGTGKVGSENGKPRVDFQISQRADFYESLTGSQTMYKRPIVNSRDEALCETSSMARLHVIFFDSSLCHVANFLKIGTTQIVLAMMEQERVDCNLILADPLAAVTAWSHDPDLRTRAATLSGSKYTAVEVQLAILEQAQGFVAGGHADGVVPHASDILEYWEDTLLRLRAGDLDPLTPRLDWVLKRFILERAMSTRPALNWDSPEVKHLDHLYGSLEDGLFWFYDDGFVEKLVSHETVSHFTREPPEDTRAWLRSEILRYSNIHIDTMDWDYIRFRMKEEERGLYPSYTYKTLRMEDPLLSRQACEPIFERTISIGEALESLGLEETDCYGRTLEKGQRDTVGTLPLLKGPGMH
jgi:proteasome accessory factor A